MLIKKGKEKKHPSRISDKVACKDEDFPVKVS